VRLVPWDGPTHWTGRADVVSSVSLQLADVFLRTRTPSLDQISEQYLTFWAQSVQQNCLWNIRIRGCQNCIIDYPQ
jgi:hypothetical protein